MMPDWWYWVALTGLGLLGVSILIRIVVTVCEMVIASRSRRQP